MTYAAKSAHPQAAPLPRHLVNNICPSGRYVSFVEDEPLVWTQTFYDRQSAIDSMRWFVSQRLTLNGGGWGAVVDNEAGVVVAVDEMPMPLPSEMTEFVRYIRAWHRGGGLR